MTTGVTNEGAAGVGRVREEDEWVGLMRWVFYITAGVGTVVMEEEVALVTGVDGGCSVVTGGVAAGAVDLLA